MAKKVTINGSNLLSSLSDDWGGVNTTQASQTIHGTTVPPGAEWGMNRGEVERIIKSSINAQQSRVGYYVCANDASTSAKTVVASGYQLTSGGCIRIKMNNANTANNVTLNINSTGAKALYYDGSQASATNTWKAGEVLEVYYDGTQYKCAGGGDAQFATGEKVKDVSIDDELDDTSDGLPTNATVTKAIEDDEYVVVKSLLSHDVRLEELEGRKTIGENEEFVIAKSLVEHDERIEHLEGTAIGEEEEYVMAKALTELNMKDSGGQGTETAKIETLTIANSDTIEVVSSSFGAGNHEVAGKNWVAKLSLFSDFYFTNNSWDGANNTAHLRSLRAGGRDGNKYALCVCMENNPGDMTANVKMRDIENLCRTYIGMGVIPIVGTQYSYNPNHDMCMIINHYAEQNKLVFADLYYYCRYLASTLARSMFDLGSHLGTRNATIMSDFYGRVLDFLPRPVKSMKIFKLRSSYTTTNLDELVFITNEQRAKRFMELNFVAWGLTDISKVDNNPNPGTHYPIEYSLINSTGVTFTSAALVSAVLPYTSHNLSKVAFAAKFIGNVHVYVRNVVAQPYPVAATYVRFTIMDSSASAPSQNDVYSDGTNNYIVYMTVSGENGSNYTLYSTGTFNESDPQTGNLTKVSGFGPSTIPYTLREQVTLGGSEVILADNCGHWVEMPNANGEYDATPFIKNSMDIDKIHFLITGDNFTMISPKIYYSGNGSKVYQYNIKEFHYNEDNPNDELIQESVFGAVGSELTYWTDDNGDAITTESTYEDAHGVSDCHPSGCLSVVNVTDILTMKQSLSASVTRVAPLTLEIWCRYFPPVYTDGSGNQITEDSYDYNTLQVSVGGVTMEENISTAWGKYQFTIKDLKRFSAANQYIRISAANSYGIQIGKVSLKYKI